MTTDQLAEIKKHAALQFTPEEIELGLGLPRGTIEGDQAVMAEYLRASMMAKATARAVVFNSARNGDSAAAREFLRLGEGLSFEAVPDEEPRSPTRRRKGKPTP